jgi:phosphatidylserine decarboxylase
MVGALPTGAMSRLAGRVARARLPGPVLRTAIRAFTRIFSVDLEEARDGLASYATFQDFFTRALRAGARPIDPAPDAFVSPCDGTWGAAGTIRDGTLLQIKGRPYSLAQLLGSDAEAARLEGGSFATLYLSPRDYHRFHAPCDLAVVAARYLPGRLLPVNRIGLEGFDALFAQNERICAWMAPDAREHAPLCLVAVGATMVGAVKLDFDTLQTNVPGGSPIQRRYDPPIKLFRGQEWGRFEFGSTIVVLAAPGFVALDAKPGEALRLGERIGTLS